MGTTSWYGVDYPESTAYVKDGATAMQTIATGLDTAVAIPVYNNQTGTSYTFVLADTGKVVTANNASAVTFTIPPQTSVAWTNNTSLRVTNLGAGTLSIAGGAGVTVTNSAATIAQYSSATIVRTASNAWTVVPAGSPAGLTLVKSQTIGTAVSSVTVSSAFSADYDSYLIVISGGASSAGGGWGVMTLGATTSGYYWQEFGTSWNGSFGGNGGANVASWASVGTISGDGLNLVMSLNNPFLSKRTYYSVTSTDVGLSYGRQGFGFLNNTISYTSFTWSPNSGTITGGTIRVYGYRN